MCQISINSEVLILDQFGPKGSKYLIKIIFDIKIETSIFQITIRSNFNKFLAFFHFETNWGLTIGKYLIKKFFDIKIEICIFEILDVPNFNKF